MTSAESDGGDPVCWLHELCPTCGAVPTPELPDRCWRCGTPAVADLERGSDSTGEHPGAWHPTTT